MEFEYWYRENGYRGETAKSMLKEAWNASRENISQRECFQRGVEAGRRSMLEEAVAYLMRYHEQAKDDTNIGLFLADKIGELK
jgi:hypothetical protein